MAEVVVYRASFKSGLVLDFFDPDDMREYMEDENNYELLDGYENAVQFDIDRDIAAIKRLKVGGKWVHALGTVERLKIDESDMIY